MEHSRQRCTSKLSEIDGEDQSATVNESMRLSFDDVVISGDRSKVDAVFGQRLSFVDYPNNKFIINPNGTTEFKNKNTVFNSESVHINTNNDRYGFIWNGKSMNPELLDNDNKFVVKMSQPFINNLFTLMKNFDGLENVNEKDVNATNIFVSPKDNNEKIFKYLPILNGISFKGVFKDMQSRRIGKII